MGKNGVHFMSYFQTCIQPELNKTEQEDVLTPQKQAVEKIKKTAVKMLENSIGIGQVKIGTKIVSILYHVYHIIDYLDEDDIDFYHASFEVGAVVKDTQQIIE
jgi:hypothetical protein